MTQTTTARNEAAQLQQTATEQARGVADEVKNQAQQTTHDLQQSLRDRTDEEAARLAQTLHDASRQMNTMADAGEQSLAATVVRESGRAAERLASHIDEGGVERVMADVRSWARRNPGGFLLGAAAAGFVVGRLARNMSRSTGDGQVGGRTEDAGIYASPGLPS